VSHAQHQGPSIRPSGAWAGWATFGAVILTLIGALNLFQGFVALFDDGFFIARNEDELFLVDYTGWGVIMLIWGLLLVTAGLSVGAGKTWARWFAVLLAFINVIAQIGFLPAYPIWSAIMILLDVLVIFALTARWDEAWAAM
jgi:hypothetical protein